MSLSPAVFLVLLLSSSVAGQTALPVADSPPQVAGAPAAPEEGRKDYAQISLEELLNKDITVAATKTRVDVAKAPVSVTVLTPDDIRRSGATRLGDVLRAVPGLDVLESFPGQISVSARGTSEVFNNNMLVLVDGRRLEFQASGVPYFENTPVRLEDIKRIEVIKGPVGALYGTNALAGIISITTYSPRRGTRHPGRGPERETATPTWRRCGRRAASARAAGGTRSWAATTTRVPGRRWPARRRGRRRAAQGRRSSAWSSGSSPTARASISRRASRRAISHLSA